jgi:hypothetical protein
VLEQQVQHCHEVRLTRTKTAVQAAGLAVGGIDRAADEPECIIEAGDQRRRDHIMGKGVYWLGDTYAEVKDKVPLSTRSGRSGISAISL